jgi:hypothetical protein
MPIDITLNELEPLASLLETFGLEHFPKGTSFRIKDLENGTIFPGGTHWYSRRPVNYIHYRIAENRDVLYELTCDCGITFENTNWTQQTCKLCTEKLENETEKLKPNPFRGTTK